jgi:hypothetical protein
VKIWLCLTVVSRVLRQRCAAAVEIWLFLTVVSRVLRQRCAAAVEIRCG